MHVGIIMDGNGRWAVSRGLARLIGHKRGASRVKGIVKICPSLGIETLTLYAFSTENWKRAAHEVEGLMKLFRGYMQNNLVELHDKNVRVRFLGDPTPLAEDIRFQMEQLSNKTKDNTGLNLNIAINYGGRDELLRAFKGIHKKINAGQLTLESVDELVVSQHLDTNGQNDPDLIIRTAGEVRVSNFMTWQSVYSEFVFLDLPWPEFTPSVLKKTIDDFGARNRQFGAVIENTKTN